MQQDEPPRTAVDAAATIRRARRLRLRVRARALSELTGAYAGARPGVGLTFADLRPYEPGDDVRHLDWNVTARQGKPYVRTFVEERALTVWILVDVSASMRFGPEGKTKADRAAETAVLLATAATQSGDRVGLMLVSDRVEAELQPEFGPRHLASIARMLVATPTESPRTSLATALDTLSRRNQRRALIVVLGDFYDPDSFPSSRWAKLAAKHQILALRVISPAEVRLPRAGLLDLIDPETGRRRTIDTTSERVRAAYVRQAIERDRAFRRWCAETGVAGHDFPTESDPIIRLVRILSSGRPLRPR